MPCFQTVTIRIVSNNDKQTTTTTILIKVTREKMNQLKK
jgi:hypothetical protein